MIKKRVLLEQLDLHAVRLAQHEVKIENLEEELSRIGDQMRELADKATQINGKVNELGRIIEEDFLPEDSEYRKMKENADDFVKSVNAILTYQGNKGKEDDKK